MFNVTLIFLIGSKKGTQDDVSSSLVPILCLGEDNYGHKIFSFIIQLDKKNSLIWFS